MSLLLPYSPHWRDVACWPQARLDGPLRRWLTLTDSLTAHLNRLCGARVTVTIISEGWQVPRRDEAQYLRTPPRQRLWLREVVLSCGTTSWVAARTLVPPATLVGRNRQLSHLGNRPLGGWLFAQPHRVRGPLQLAHLASLGGAVEWGRRSVFYLRQQPLLVSEYFLSPLVERLCHEGAESELRGETEEIVSVR
jgi:chorismate lyase